MAGRRQGDTKEFRELSFAEQAKSITATINNLQAAIEHHVAHSPRRLETIEKCLAQVERLGRRLRDSFDQQIAESSSDQTFLDVEEMPRLRVGSPRLARPEQAADFAMDVAEVSPDAGL
jgi:predicted Zn-dependent protease